MNEAADAPDEELLSRIGATQDRAAFAELFTQYVGRRALGLARKWMTHDGR